MEQLVLKSENSTPITTSLLVAKIFGKRHDHVLRDIENLSCSDSFRAANFGETPYTHPQNGQEYRMCTMTKDGFSFLVMGYTGQKAAKFKEDFLMAFNKMESMLKSDDYILARSQEILQNRLQAAQQRVQMLEGANEHLTSENKTLAPKAQYTDEVLQSVNTYTSTQMAKELDFTSANKLHTELKKRGVMFFQSGQWLLTAKYCGNRYTESRTHPYPNSKGLYETTTITVWTERGRWFLHQLFNK